MNMVQKHYYLVEHEKPIAHNAPIMNLYLSLIWSLLLFLSSSFLLILGQELLETRPLLFVVSRFFLEIPDGPVGPVSRSVRPV